MHIPEGLLPVEQAAAWFAPAVGFVGAGLSRIKRKVTEVPEFKTLVGLMGAFVFLTSLMPIPVPGLGTVSHPCGTPLAAIVLGPFVSVVLGAAALLLQALFFAHGGLSTWGGNIVSMGVGGSFVGFGVFWLAKRLGAGLAPAAALAGFCGDIATYAITSAELGLALHGDVSVLTTAALAFASFLPTQLPLAILEGVFTAGVLSYLARQRRDILAKLAVVTP